MENNSQTSLLEKIKQEINYARVYIQNDGGDVAFVSFEKGILTLEVLGHCVGCASFDTTFTYGLKAILMEKFPEIKDVKFSLRKTV